MNYEEATHLDRTKRFMLYQGRIRPSDAYLKAHPLPDYVEGDPYNDAYDLQIDHDVLLAERVCIHCGASFTLSEAIETVKCAFVPYPVAYEDHFIGEACGACAIRAIDSLFLHNPELRV